MKNFFYFLLLMCVMPSVMAQNEDQRIWTEGGIKGVISKNWGYRFSAGFRWNGEQEKDNNYYQLSFSHKFHAHWGVGLGYRHHYSKGVNNQWEKEQRFLGSLTYKKKNGCLEVSDRNQIDYRIFESLDNRVRYRNQVKMALPFKLDELPLTPYISGELNYSFYRSSWNRFRGRMGLDMTIGSWSPNLFIQYQTDKGQEEWNDFYAIGISFYFKAN